MTFITCNALPVPSIYANVYTIHYTYFEMLISGCGNKSKKSLKNRTQKCMQELKRRNMFLVKIYSGCVLNEILEFYDFLWRYLNKSWMKWTMLLMLIWIPSKSSLVIKTFWTKRFKLLLIDSTQAGSMQM